MSYMFYYAESFNCPLMTWDVSRATNMESMFDSASAGIVEKRRRVGQIRQAAASAMYDKQEDEIGAPPRAKGFQVGPSQSLPAWKCWDSNNVIRRERAFGTLRRFVRRTTGRNVLFSPTMNPLRPTSQHVGWKVFTIIC